MRSPKRKVDGLPATDFFTDSICGSVIAAGQKNSLIVFERGHKAHGYVSAGKVSVVTITDGEVITINEGKRSTGSGGRGIGIRVCVGRRVYPKLEKFQTERPAKNAGRASR